MSDNDNRLLFEIRKKIQADVGEIKTRLDRLEERMERLERRQTASMHFEQSVLVHLTGINESIDNLRAEIVGTDRRIKALEAR